MYTVLYSNVMNKYYIATIALVVKGLSVVSGMMLNVKFEKSPIGIFPISGKKNKNHESNKEYIVRIKKECCSFICISIGHIILGIGYR